MTRPRPFMNGGRGQVWGPEAPERYGTGTIGKRRPAAGVGGLVERRRLADHSQGRRPERLERTHGVPRGHSTGRRVHRRHEEHCDEQRTVRRVSEQDDMSVKAPSSEAPNRRNDVSEVRSCHTAEQCSEGHENEESGPSRRDTSAGDERGQGKSSRPARAASATTVHAAPTSSMTQAAATRIRARSGLLPRAMAAP